MRLYSCSAYDWTVRMPTIAAQAKVVQFLRELVPAAASLGLLVNDNYRRFIVANYPSFPEPDPSFTEARAAARELGWESKVFEAPTTI